MQSLSEHLSIFYQFCYGVCRRIIGRISRCLGYIVYEERRFAGFIKRLIEVEKRISGTSKRIQFLLRWGRYYIHKYSLLPPWIKLLKLIFVLFVIYGPTAVKKIEQHYEYGRLYAQFYEYYYQQFSRQYTDNIARQYASMNAQQYAQYYTSEKYKDALRYALPDKAPSVARDSVAWPEDFTAEDETIISIPRGNVNNSTSKRDELYSEFGIISPFAVELIKHFEGLMLKPYQDAGGRYTIGYGHMIRANERFMQIDKAKAEQLLLKDVKIAENIVLANVKVKLNMAQFSALVSLVYNIGGYQFRNSTLLKKLNAGDYSAAAREFLRWNKVAGKKIRGLQRRREMEFHLFYGSWQKENAMLVLSKTIG